VRDEQQPGDTFRPIKMMRLLAGEIGVIAPEMRQAATLIISYLRWPEGNFKLTSAIYHSYTVACVSLL
jgi:hypothetical protein